MNRPGAATFARSWTPAGGGFQGLMMSHDEVFSIGDLLSLRSGGHLTYRPTVMFVYHPCDDAMLSVLELEGRGWQPQQRQRRLGADIVTGMDELGVLLAGHSRNAYWYGSQLSIEDARRHVSYANATSGSRNLRMQFLVTDGIRFWFRRISLPSREHTKDLSPRNRSKHRPHTPRHARLRSRANFN